MLHYNQHSYIFGRIRESKLKEGHYWPKIESSDIVSPFPVHLAGLHLPSVDNAILSQFHNPG